MHSFALATSALHFILVTVTTWGWEEQHDEVGVRLKLECLEDEVAFLEQLAAKQPSVAERIRDVVTGAWKKHDGGQRRRLALENGLSEEDKKGLLQRHNKYRNITAQGNTPGHPSAANMDEMLWDDAVASVAQNWADNCFWGHNAARQSDFAAVQAQASFVPTSTYIGENIYVSGRGYSQDTLLAGITLFYNEYSGYDYNTRECSFSMCGHYTQLVWDDSRYLGCGAAVCDMTGLDWNDALFLVCNYHRGGNYPRQPYTNGDECSDCPVDRIVCEDGLCGGCPSPNFYTCGGSTDGDCSGTVACDSEATTNEANDDSGDGKHQFDDTTLVIIGVVSLFAMFLLLAAVGYCYYNKKDTDNSHKATGAPVAISTTAVGRLQRSKQRPSHAQSAATRSVPPRAPSRTLPRPPPRRILGTRPGRGQGHVSEMIARFQ